MTNLSLLRRCLLLLCLCSLPVLAAEPWRLLVLAEHSDPVHSTHSAVPPQVLRRVEQSLLEQLANAGQTVYDRRLAGLPPCEQQHCFGLDDTALISLARRSSKSIDAVLMYDLELSEFSGPALQRWRIGMPLYIIELESGKRISSWQGFSRDFDDLPVGCTGSCFNQWLAERAALVAADAGYAITEQLFSYPRTYRYTLALQGFALGEYQAIEQWLLEPAEFEQARLALQQTQHNRRQLLHAVADKTYTLSTQRGAGSTEALLRQVFDSHAMSVQLQLQPGTRHFQINRQGLPYSRHYLLAVLLSALLLLMLWYGRFFWRHHPELQQLAAKGQFVTLNNRLTVLQRQLLPFWPQWRRWQQQAKALQYQVQQLADHTSAALQSGDYQQARQPLLQLSEQISDSGQLQQWLQQLDQAERAQQLLQVAKTEHSTAPAKALRRLSEALQLNPYLQEELTPLLEQTQHIVRNELVHGALTEGQALLDQGLLYQALSQIDLALLQIGQLAHFVAEREQLQRLRQQVADQIQPLQHQLRLSCGAVQAKLWLSDNLLLARKAVPDQPSLALGYQRLSRPGKQNLIRYQERCFWLEDQGSSNGSWLSSSAVPAGFTELGSKAIPLHQPMLLAMGGEKNPPRPGICQLQLSPGRQVPGALMLRLDHSSISLLEQSAISQIWASLLQDQQQATILLADQLALGIDQGELDIGCLHSSEPLAILHRTANNQLLLEPVLNGESSAIHIGGVPQYGRIPLDATFVLQLAELSIQLVQE